MRKISYEKFMSKAPDICKVPSMQVEVLVDGKQTEQFEVPPGFQLDRYAISVHSGAEVHFHFDGDQGEFGALVVEVFYPLATDGLQGAVEKIIKVAELALPDVIYVGKYKKENLNNRMAKAGGAIAEFNLKPDGTTLIREYKKNPFQQEIERVNDEFSSDDEKGGGHA